MLQNYYDQAYDPESTPRPDVPSIQVQHASALTPGFGNRQVLNKQPSKDSFTKAFDEGFGHEYDNGMNPYPAATGNGYAPAGSRSVSNSSYGSHATYGAGHPEAQSANAAAADTSIKSAVAKYHDRFNTPSPPRATHYEIDEFVPSASGQSLGVSAAATRGGGGHSHEASAASQISWHTATDTHHDRSPSNASKFTAL